MKQRLTDYSFNTWAREAEVIMVDIDPAEMKKHTIHVDMPVWADARDFLETLNECLQKEDDKISSDTSTALE